MTIRHQLMMTAAAAALVAAQPVLAGVSADEAAKLKTTLTPLGGERAGNKDGTIPAWDGGYTKSAAGEGAGGRRGDPFASEKPLFTVTAKNMDEHGAKLTDGVKALLKKYPDSYRLNVYKTHRTAAAPQWVYDNTFKNATHGKLEGDVPSNIYGGIPFPIPKTGAEVMWNHLLRWNGEAFGYATRQYQFTADGKRVLVSAAGGDFQVPYYFKDGSWEQFEKTQEYWLFRVTSTAPPMRAGEALTIRYNLNADKDQGWTYLAGQRRVRKIPNPCCDSPNPSSGGLGTIDETQSWNGRIDRFDWKIVGKQEMYIPYNSNRLLQPSKDDEILDAHHLKSDFLRWELHRVWVVEATVRPGKRHLASKLRYYCDEDTWMCVLGDRWDAKGELWKTLWLIPVVIPELPAVFGGTFGAVDLLSGTGFVSTVFNEGTQYTIKARQKDTLFTPDAMAGEGVR